MPTMRELSATELRVLRELLDEAFDFLQNGDVDQARVSTGEAVAMAPLHPEVLRLQAEIAWTLQQDDEAEALLQRALEADPDDADAHHLLARVHEARDERAAMIEHDLRVLALDAAADARAGLGGPDDLRFIETCAKEVLDALPDDFAERMADIPVVLEARPSEGTVRDGFDARALGLFEGATDSLGRQISGLELTGSADLRPTRIVLFYANLLATCRDPEELAEQVEVTILHEIGHFFDLDEDEVAALGLE
jgi:predicted Zn-dependent protease with MMP-like domain